MILFEIRNTETPEYPNEGQGDTLAEAMLALLRDLRHPMAGGEDIDEETESEILQVCLNSYNSEAKSADGFCYTIICVID